MLAVLAGSPLGLPAQQQSVLLAPLDCGDGCTPGATVHGDPMFKVNGTGTHFWLKEGNLTPLLLSGDVTLSGKTFNRPDTGHQWFDEFVVSNKGKAVLDVATVEGQTQAKLNGKVVSSGKLNADGVEVEFDTEGIKAKAGALAVTIYSSQATKFASGTDKAKYEHLNINFASGIPTDAKGIFAELAGVQEMSEATTALLKQPKGVVLYQAAAKQCPSGCVATSGGDGTDTSGGDGTDTGGGGGAVSLSCATPADPAPKLLKSFALGATATSACAILQDGALKCWGRGDYGNLGQGSTEQIGQGTPPIADIPPVDLGTNHKAVAIFSLPNGNSHCAILDSIPGDIKCWGANTRGEYRVWPDLTDASKNTFKYIGDKPGQMGDALPIVDFGDNRKVMQLTMGNIFQCAIFDTIPGEAKCWGDNYYGQLGIGMEAPVETNCLLKTCYSPGITMKDGPMLPFGPHVVEIHAGANQVCVRLDTGDVKCWGEAHYGLGYDNGAHKDLGKKPEHMTDLPAIDLGVGKSGDPRKAAALFGDYTHTCVILDTVPGDLKCWGDNQRGQCGYDHKKWIGRGQDADDILMKDLPVVDFGLNANGDQKQVASYCGAADVSCAILDSIPGDVVCWGLNNYGQLGMGVRPTGPGTPSTYSAGDGVGIAMVDLVPLDFGVDENGEKRKATAIQCGRYFNCATVAPDNALFCWGYNGQSVCGLDNRLPRYAYSPMMTNMKPSTCPTGN